MTPVNARVCPSTATMMRFCVGNNTPRPCRKCVLRLACRPKVEGVHHERQGSLKTLSLWKLLRGNGFAAACHLGSAPSKQGCPGLN